MTPSASVPHAEHIVQLFDSARSRAAAAARFLADGWTSGEHILVIARPSHWTLIAEQLEQHGCPVQSGGVQPWLHVLDAKAVLRRMRRRGIFVRDAVPSVIAELLDQAVPAGQPLRLYGEVVDILAEEGSFNEACALEEAWSEVTASRPLRLFCGYSAAHFADPQKSDWLRQICEHHTHVRSHASDILGHWLSAGIVGAHS